VLCLLLVIVVAVLFYFAGFVRSALRILPAAFGLGLTLGCFVARPPLYECVFAIIPAAALCCASGYFDRVRSVAEYDCRPDLPRVPFELQVEHAGVIAPLYPFRDGEACPQCRCVYRDGVGLEWIRPGCHCVCHD
jgi:hypothetical protein